MRKLLLVGFVSALLALVAFLGSQAIGGKTWDEDVHSFGYRQIVEFAVQVLVGESPDYRSIHHDLEYYGLLPLTPAELTRLVAVTIFELSSFASDEVFRISLHATAFFWAMGTVFVLGACLKAITGNWIVATLTETNPRFSNCIATRAK